MEDLHARIEDDTRYARKSLACSNGMYGKAPRRKNGINASVPNDLKKLNVSLECAIASLIVLQKALVKHNWKIDLYPEKYKTTAFRRYYHKLAIEYRTIADDIQKQFD